MRIATIAAGAAGAHCGACARDVALARGLRARGHDALFMPVYTPVHTDGADPTSTRVFYGGINAWLQQHVGLFRRTPRFVDWLLDRPFLLRLASRVAVDTRPEGLGPMTVSVLRGADGKQRKELAELLDYLERRERPHIVHLTNSLLAAIAPAARDRLGVPVVCTLQGEEGFLAGLPQPYRRQAHDLVRRHAQAIDLFLAPSQDYAAEMAGWLGVEPDRVRVVRAGVDTEVYASGTPRVREPFRIGFLSRVAQAKGIDLLCEAFRLLERERPGAHVLAVAGQVLGRSRRFWRRLRRRLRADGLGERVEFRGELDLEGKIAFLRGCSVFCLPSRIVERRAVAALEALAAGVPVVVPERGVFPEMLALTGGGLAVTPDDPAALAAAIARLRDDPELADQLGRAGAAGAAEHYSVPRMVDHTLAAYEALLASGA